MKALDFVASTVLGLIHMIAVAFEEYQLILGGMLHVLLAIPFVFMGIGIAIDAPWILILLCLVVTHQWLWYSLSYEGSIRLTQLMALRGGLILLTILVGYYVNTVDYAFWALPVGGVGQFIYYHYHELFSHARQIEETNHAL